MSSRDCRFRYWWRVVASDSVADPQAAVGIEQVEVAGIGGHVDDLAGAGCWRPDLMMTLLAGSPARWP
jgi:hypothetical protein